MLADSYLDTIELFACGMKVKLPEGNKCYSEEEIYQIEKIARSQGIWTVVFAVVKQLFEAGRAAVLPTTISKWQMEINLKVMQYTCRQEAVYRFLENELAFCNPIILKGDTVADLYANPELRMSGDTDVLIDPKDEKKVLAAFIQAGGEYKKRNENNNQAVCVHPRAGLFEIHISLDTKEVSEVWYDGLDFGAEEKRLMQLKNGHSVTTLGITDGAINMILHFLKHMIGGIAQLKMLGDSLLYLTHYCDEIDFQRVDEVMAHLGYATVYEAMKWIGTKYFGFSELQGKECYDIHAEKILLDLQFCAEQKFDEEKLNVYNEYSKSRYETFHKKDYATYKKNLIKREAFGRLFPGRTKLYQEYPILVKHGWILPGIWLVRIWKKIFSKKETVEKQTEQRLELLKDLDIL